ncbi:MAG: glycosyltransferase family 39 protein [Candidatus Omnitrophota bacterium]
MENDWQAPGYYGLVWLYSYFFHNAMALRWMSVVIGLLGLMIFYLISRQILWRWEALGAFVIMAASPFHIWHSQEARPYTTISFFSLLAVYFLMGAARTNKWLWWAAFLCAGIAAVAMSYYSIVLFAMVGFVSLNKRSGLLLFRGTLFLALIGAAVIPLVPGLIAKINYIYYGAFWLRPPTLRVLLFSPLVFTAGYLAYPWQMAFGFLLCWPLLVRGMFVFFREEKEKFIFILACSCLPVFLIFLVSRWGMPIYLDRQLIVFAPFFYLFMARGVGSIKGKAFKTGSIFLMGIFLIMALVNYYQGTIYCYKDRLGDFYPGVHPRKNYGDIMRKVIDELRPGDTIVTPDMQSRTIVQWVLWGNPATSKKALHIFIFSLKTLLEYEKQFLKDSKKEVRALAFDDRDLYGVFYYSQIPQLRNIKERDFELQRVWFIFSSWDKNAIFDKNVGFVRKTLQNKFRKTKSFDQDGFFVELYEKKDVIGR